MEGSYDKVWGAMDREGRPAEEFGVFSEVGYILVIQGLPLLRWEKVSKKTRQMADKGLLLGPHRHHPSGNRVLLRKSVPFITGA